MAGTTTGTVKTVLRLEGLVVFTLMLIIYNKLGYSWGDFFIYFLIPDIAFLAYLVGPKTGAITYNTTHSYIGACLLFIPGFMFDYSIVISLSIIWFSHIGIDRALGFGLKYSDGFKYTHLGLLGKTGKEGMG